MRATAVLQKCLGSALGSMRALRSRVLSERTLTCFDQTRFDHHHCVASTVQMRLSPSTSLVSDSSAGECEYLVGQPSATALLP